MPVTPSRQPLAAFAVFCLLSGTSALAGVIYEVEVQDHRQSPPKTEKLEILVEGASLKMDIVSGESSESDVMIFRGARQEMIFIDHGGRSFALIERATLDRINQHDDAAKAHMQ